jgi:glycosyltransferase involved in cell wall biosynthesis
MATTASPTLVSAVVCTRNRGGNAVATIDTLLANTYPNLEVILVDQSVDQDTAAATEHFRADPRFRYIHTHTQGSSVAHNLGLAQACGEIIAFTDDDCTVPTNWVAAMAAVFESIPRVAVAFCNVSPGSYDSSKGFIPSYSCGKKKLIRSLWDKCGARGIGAGMAVRKAAALALGGFDPLLGPGSPFHACLDGDLAVRALLGGWWVYETDTVAVIHNGFRSWQEGRLFTERAWFGIGAAYAKPLKCGRWSILAVIGYEAVVIGLLHPLARLLSLRRPQGLRQIVYFSRGLMRGLRTPIDRDRIVYELD